MESPLSQREPQVLDKKVISGVSKTEQQIRTREYTGAKTGSTSQPLAVPSIADSQSSLNMKGTPGRRAIELVSTEHRGQESRNARKERKRKPTWETSETGANVARRRAMQKRPSHNRGKLHVDANMQCLSQYPQTWHVLSNSFSVPSPTMRSCGPATGLSPTLLFRRRFKQALRTDARSTNERRKSVVTV